MAETVKRSEMTVREAGRLGGCKVRDEGLVDYVEMGRKGGNKTAGEYGSQHYREIGAKGGAATAERHGTEHYERIGRKGGARVKALIAAAKAAEVVG